MPERWNRDAHAGWTGSSVRASDAERDLVVTALQQHYVDGRITDEELSERVDEALAARTRGELSQVTRDLPPLPRPAAAQPERRDGRSRRRAPVAALLVAVMTALFVLPGIAFLVAGPGDWDGPPPLLPFLFVWLTLRLTTRSRWR